MRPSHKPNCSLNHNSSLKSTTNSSNGPNCPFDFTTVPIFSSTIGSKSPVKRPKWPANRAIKTIQSSLKRIEEANQTIARTIKTISRTIKTIVIEDNQNQLSAIKPH